MIRATERVTARFHEQAAASIGVRALGERVRKCLRRRGRLRLAGKLWNELNPVAGASSGLTETWIARMEQLTLNRGSDSA